MYSHVPKPRRFCTSNQAIEAIVGQVVNLRPIGNRPVATLNVSSRSSGGLSRHVEPSMS